LLSATAASAPKAASGVAQAKPKLNTRLEKGRRMSQINSRGELNDRISVTSFPRSAAGVSLNLSRFMIIDFSEGSILEEFVKIF
jgi:hypothetical protein